MLLEIDENNFLGNHSESQIQVFMQEYGLTRLETILYLYAFNNICNIYPKDRNQNCGRKMYLKFAKGFSCLLKVKDGE